MGLQGVGHGRVTNSLPLILPLLSEIENRVGKEAKVKGVETGVPPYLL